MWSNDNYTAFMFFVSRLPALGIGEILIVAGIAVFFGKLSPYHQVVLDTLSLKEIQLIPQPQSP